MCKIIVLFLLISVNYWLSDCTVTGGGTGVNRYTCPNIRILNGRVRYRQKGRIVKFQCNSGYLIAGERYSSCVKNKWEIPPPVCVRPTCSKVLPPVNGMIFPSHQGAVLNFFCRPGYTLRGKNMTYCDGNRWSTNLPSCIGSGTEPTTSCDFESEDLCGWSHDLNHDFDWRRQNFQTPSGHIGTGPSFDHTKGSGQDGYYMYIESSSRLENDTARLISPVYNKMENGLCFTFYYHMYGSTTGQLRVYIKKESQSYKTKYLKPLFWESGNQGDIWKKGIITMDNVDEPFQVIIEGIRGNGYVSDIAVDDVDLSETCPDEDFSSTTTDYSTPMFPIIETCENRCENSSFDLENQNDFVISCECVESCIENNTCCPDYIAFCVLDDSTINDEDINETTTESEFISKFTEEPKIETTFVQKISSKFVPKIAERYTTISPKSTQKVTPKSTQKVTPKSTQKITPKIETKSNKPTPVPPKIIPKITQKMIIPKMPTEIPRVISNTNSTKNNQTKPDKKNIPVPNNTNTINKNVPINIPEKPVFNRTTTKGPQKVPIKLPTTKKVPRFDPEINPFDRTTSKSPQKIPIQLPITKKVPIFSTKNPKSYQNETSTERVESLEVETDYDENENFPKSTKNENYKTTEPRVQMISNNLKILSEKREGPRYGNIILVVVFSLIFVMLAILSVIFVVRRYNLRFWRGFRNNNSRNDSLSDVRFLAGDEILDFSLRTSD